MYEAEQLEEFIEELVALNRPVICLNIWHVGMARHFSFLLSSKTQYWLHKLGFVAGKSQTHFDWHDYGAVERVQAEDSLR